MTRVSKFLVSMAAALVLLGCQIGDGLLQKQPAAILGGSVNIASPSGYCIDRKQSREADDSAVMLMGRCSADAKATAALVSVTVGRAGSAGVMAQGPAPLAAYFQTNEGQAALSRDGNAGAVQIERVSSAGGVLFLLVRDRVQGAYWRAITTARGRLISISATGTPDIPLDTDAGRKLVDATLSAIGKANPPLDTAASVISDG